VKIPGKSSQELYDKVSSDIDRFIGKAAPLGKFDIERDAGGKQVKLKSSMVSATLVCLEGELKLEASLSLFAAPFRSKIDEGIDKWLAKTFNINQA
jgi:hypothetical protein